MTLAAFESALKEVVARLGKVTSAVKAKALVVEFTALANQVPSLVPPIVERRRIERRGPEDTVGPQRRLIQRRLISGTPSMPVVVMQRPGVGVSSATMALTIQPSSGATNDIALAQQPVVQLTPAVPGQPGATPASRDERRVTPEWQACLAFEIARNRELYRHADTGIAMLPGLLAASPRLTGFDSGSGTDLRTTILSTDVGSANTAYFLSVA